MLKVICTICHAIYKVREDPPAAIVAPGGVDSRGRPLDPYMASAIELTSDPDAVDYCQRTCPLCRRDSPWPSEFQRDEPDDEPHEK